jgi:hypothetical protein
MTSGQRILLHFLKRSIAGSRVEYFCMGITGHLAY